MPRRKAVGSLLLLLLAGSMGVLCWLTYRNIRQDRLNHALITAIQHRDVSAGLAVLYAGADSNTREDTSKSISFWQSLRRLFAGVWQHNKTLPAQPGLTALLLALQGDEVASEERKPAILSPLIRALVARGANVNSRDKAGYTPLILAVGQEPADTVQAMLDKGADVNARNNYGRTALMWAVLWSDTNIVKTLLARGADVNARDNEGGTALITAVSVVGDTNIVKVLLVHGADFHIKDIYGDTTLFFAKAKGQRSIIHLLKLAGAKE